MDIKFVNKIDQQYDVGRVRNLSLCNCKSCDFVNCPKNNYSAEKTLYVYSVDEFVKENKNLLSGGLTGELIDEFFEFCVDYPCDYYYRRDDMDTWKVYIVKLNKTGETRKACFSIRQDKVSFVNNGLSKENYRWCLSVLRDIEEVVKG